MEVLNSFKKMISGSRLIVLIIFSLVLLAVPSWAATGSGTLTVTDNTDCAGDGFDEFVSPKFWEVFLDKTVHINISPGFMICTVAPANLLNKTCTTGFADCTAQTDKGTCSASGMCIGSAGSKKCNNNNNKSCTVNGDCSNICTGNSPAPHNSGSACTTNTDCSVNIGTCTSALECSGDTTVFVKGFAGQCTEASDCDAGQTCDAQICNTGSCSLTNLTCTVDSDCPSLCTFSDPITTSGRGGNQDIDVCYKTRDDMCSEAHVAYCNDMNLFANVNHPVGTSTFQTALLRAVDSNGDPLTDCAVSDSTCTNDVGSFCCGLTQGAYGAPNSVATALPGIAYGDCDSGDPTMPAPGSGFLPAAACLGCDAFDGDPNATTIGIHGTKSVTIDTLNTLITWLPAGGQAKYLSNSVGADNHYPTSSFPPGDLTGGGSKGSGGGVLSGQALACSLNAFLSNCSPPWGDSGTFTASGFGGFELPSAGVLICTKRSGSDKVLDTGDDICQAFGYPLCVAGLEVSEVQDCANDQLANASNSCGCTAAELNQALSNINLQFDQCGNVIDCGAQTMAGEFTCP